MQGASRVLPDKKSDVLSHQTATINAERIQPRSPPTCAVLPQLFPDPKELSDFLQRMTAVMLER